MDFLAVEALVSDLLVAAAVQARGSLRNVRDEGPNVKSAKIQSFLDKAEECEIKALRTKDPDVRLSFSQLARQWRELAHQIEKLEWERKA
jgi:hypothetical protein